MSISKDFWTEYGFMPIEKNVCDECFEDYAIKEYIINNSEKNVCDYCGRSSKTKKIAAPVDEVIAFIMEGVETEWGRAVDEGIPWESREGGWQWNHTYDTWDLLEDKIGLEVNNEILFKEINDAFGSHKWCKKNPFMITQEEHLIPTCIQDDSHIYYRHGGDLWREKLKLASKNLLRPVILGSSVRLPRNFERLYLFY